MADIKDGYGLPDALPPLRLPSDAELARQVRAIPLVRELAALARWLGADGRPADSGGLRQDARDEALTALGVTPGRLRVLWKYALAVGWAWVEDERRAFPGETADIWAAGEDEDTLDAWASAFTAVLSEAIRAGASTGETGIGETDGEVDVHVPGAAIALVLFLSRREGLFREEARALIRDAMTGQLPPDRAERAWRDWVSAHGDPADALLGQLAEVGAVTLPPTDDGTIRCTPLTLREMRHQLIGEGVEIPLLPATAAELSPEQLLAMAEGVPAEEFEAEADAWLSVHGPERSAALLLGLAAGADPGQRLTAVSVVTRAGRAAEQAWNDTIGVPALRPYAKVALASLALGITPAVSAAAGGLTLLPDSVPPGTLSPELRPLPDDLAWLATDVVSLACCDEDTDPREIASAFARAVPAGQETIALDRLWRGPHPDAERVLIHLGRFHPDQQIANEARDAALKAATRHDD